MGLPLVHAHLRPSDLHAQLRYTMQLISYSLKFSRLNIFADFVGQSKATKIFSCEIFSSSLMLGVAGSSTTNL